VRAMFLISTVLLAASGCATTQLAFTASRQMGTLPDIYTDQVLENLARISSDTTVLPYFTLLNNGVPSTNDTGSITIGSLMFPAQSVVKQLHNQRGGTLGPIGGQRVVGTNWTLSPINDPDRLGAMHDLYIWVLTGQAPDAKKMSKLRQYLGKDFTLTSYGWFAHGGKHDVPPGACRQFHHHGTYYWIAPGNEAQFTDLTLNMLDIATRVPTAKLSQTVVWKIDPKTNEPTEIDVTRNVDYVKDKLTKIPSTPINLQTWAKAVAPDATKFHDDVLYETHAAIETAIPDGNLPPLPERYNNYSSPMISPGLFSQPPH
jgi:hypothetical protein